MERQAIKSSMRTFEVLELFDHERRPLRLQDIHTALGYPQSSATNLLKSMVVMGYVNYNLTNRTYSPTLKVSALGKWLPYFNDDNHIYQSFIDRLQKETDEVASLVSQNDLFVQYLIVEEPDHDHKKPPPQGSLRMIVDSAAGFALMSSWSNEQVDKICRYSNYYELHRAASYYEEPPHERIIFSEILSEVRSVRSKGYCLRQGKPIPEVSAIGMPLPTSKHDIQLAIGVGGLTDRIVEKKSFIVETMQRLKKELSEILAAERENAPMVAE